jgi:hypothetical protein
MAATLAALALAGPAHALAADGHTLRSAAVEIGLSGAFSSVEGASTALFGLRAGQYRRAGSIPFTYSAGIAYHHVSDADELELEAALAAVGRIGDSSAFALAGVAGSLRQEWVGSFSQDRYAVGVDLGVKFLASASAAGTIAYQYRRVLGDPVSDFNEHRVTVGLSVLFRNAKREAHE